VSRVGAAGRATALADVLPPPYRVALGLVTSEHPGRHSCGTPSRPLDEGSGADVGTDAFCCRRTGLIRSRSPL
jgi:hypothetical protein